MRQFLSVLKFEFMNFAKNKIFVGLTIFLALAIAVVLSFPRLSEYVDVGGAFKDPEKLPVLAVLDNTEGNKELTTQLFTSSLPDFKIETTTGTVEEIKDKIEKGEYDKAVIIDENQKYSYIVNNQSLTDTTISQINEILVQKYRYETMQKYGLTEEETQSILNTNITPNVIELGKNQAENFFYTYILIFLLYFSIMMYGQLVAMSVATEKNSRAMEMLITTTKSTKLMFGKVIGSGLAGLSQLVIILGTGFIFYNMNSAYYANNDIVQSIFNIPLSILIYMIVFFILGFFIYSFLYGALGSLASRTEDINTSIMPVTLIFVTAFMVVVFSMTSGSVDSTLMKVCSFIPFTSPMAMFTRIAMSTVPTIDIIVSIVILIISTVGVGYISAGIYRLGVLLYGKPPKISEIFKMLKSAKR